MSHRYIELFLNSTGGSSGMSLGGIGNFCGGMSFVFLLFSFFFIFYAFINIFFLNYFLFCNYFIDIINIDI